jgi:acetamidase/formamidase
MIEPFPTLQRMSVPDGSELHYLPADPDNVIWGRIPTVADQPVTKVEPGVPIVVDTISHEGILEDQGRDPVAFFARHGIDADLVLRDAADLAASGRYRTGDHGPHVLTGPIAVTGARPGDLLAVHVLELTPRASYGVISNRHGRGALPRELPEGPEPVFVFCRAGLGPNGAVGTIVTGEGPITFPLRFFLGMIGVATADTRHRSSIPPGCHGGNLDVRLITTGSTLYLPVQVPDALAYIGDPHFTQGDGEVALTALEAPLRARLAFDVVRPGEPCHATRPYAETADHLVPIGLDEDLGEAMRDCVRAALELLQKRYRIDRPTAYAYLSAAADFAVSQVVDGVQGIHGAIRKADLAALARTEQG